MAMVIALIFITGVSSCNKKIELLVDIDEQTICIPFYSNQLTYGHLDSFDYNVSKLKKAFEDQNLTFADNRVNNITVQSYEVEFVSGDHGNLGQIEGLNLFVKRKGESGEGKLVALVDVPENNATSLKMDLTADGLKFILEENVVTFVFKAWIRNSTGIKPVCLKLKNGKLLVNTKK